MRNRMKIITEPSCTDALRTAVSEEGSNMVLFNPPPNKYKWADGEICFLGKPLNIVEIVKLAMDRRVNKVLSDRILLYALFAFFYDKRDLRNDTVFETSVNELSYYMGLSIGRKGYPLIERLKSFETVYGLIPAEEKILPLLEIEELPEGKLILRSDYLQQVLSMAHGSYIARQLLQKKPVQGFYCNTVYADLVTAKNKVAAAIVMELAALVVRAGRAKSPHISLRTLAVRIPELHKILYGTASPSLRVKQGCRAMAAVRDILMEKTSLLEEYLDFEVIMPSGRLTDRSVIDIKHKGKRSSGSERVTDAANNQSVQEA